MSITKRNLKVLRGLHNLTQEDLSKMLNITVQSYAQKENGKRPFTLDEARIISLYFKMSIETIFFGDVVYNKET